MRINNTINNKAHPFNVITNFTILKININCFSFDPILILKEDKRNDMIVFHSQNGILSPNINLSLIFINYATVHCQ